MNTPTSIYHTRIFQIGMLFIIILNQVHQSGYYYNLLVTLKYSVIRLYIINFRFDI